ncbi:hypothetical protein ACW910_02915 [Burkholderia ambifaria]
MSDQGPQRFGGDMGRWREAVVEVAGKFLFRNGKLYLVCQTKRKRRILRNANPASQPASFVTSRINRQKRILLVMSSVDEPT